MSIKTIKIILIIFCAAVVVFIASVIYPLISDIENEAQKFLLEKKTRTEFALRIDNLKKTEDAPLRYPLVVPVTFLDFLEFVEKEAAVSQISVKLNPHDSKGQEPWPFFGFRLDLSGSFSDFVSFLEKMESSDYLINISSFTIIKGDQENIIKTPSFNFEGRVYGKIL